MKYGLLIAILTGLTLSGCSVSEQAPVASESQPQPVTRQYIREHVLQSNASIALSLKEGRLLRIGKKDLPPTMLAQYRRMAKRMGLRSVPALYANLLDEKPAPQAEARFSREGNSYIVVNRSAFDKWSRRQFIAVLGHELVHLKQKHVTANNIAIAYNNPSLSVAHELEADRVGSGPSGSCDPLALEEALAIVTKTDMRDYLEKNPRDTEQNYNALVGIDHPLFSARRALLDEMAMHPSKGCMGVRPSRPASVD